MITVEAANVRKTLSNHILTDGFEPVVDLEMSHGSWLVDGRDGREYLDLFTMFASIPVGYNHPKLLEHKDELAIAAMNKPTNSDIYTAQLAQFVESFFTVTMPDIFKYGFFIEGGALAIENALKASFDWKVRKNFQKNGSAQEMGSKVIHFNNCFHGRTGYTISLTNTSDPRKTVHFPKFDWPRIVNPAVKFPLNDNNLAEVVSLEAEALNQIKGAIGEHGNDLAALIIEPIQGEGGDNYFREEFFRELRKICDENEIMLIYDEVQTGIGLTGKMWAHQHYGVDCRPDIVSFGKKTQICGIFVSNRVDEVAHNVFHESSRLNSTWGGNIADMVRFTLYLEVIEKEGLVDKAAENGKYVLDKLVSLQKYNGDVISNVRGKGLFCAFDLPNGDVRDKMVSHIADEGALMLGCGTKSIRFRPHLNITLDEIDTGFEMIERAIQKL